MKRNMIIMVAFLAIAVTNVGAQTCPLAYFYNGQRCAPCLANCQCTSEGTCSSCLPGYTYDALFQNCLQCPTAVGLVNIGCKECCYKVKGPAFVCSTCQTGLYVYHMGGQCIKLDGCTKITDQGSCVSCASGYYLSQGACLACHMSCSTCTDASLCLTCKTAYFNGTNTHFSLCQACSLGCQTCTSAIACTACVSGYYSSAASCTSCSTNCATCTASICSACITGTVLITNACYECTNIPMQGSVGCLSCQASSTRVLCTSCSAGYYLDAATSACLTCASRYVNSILCTAIAVLQCSSDSHSTLASRFYLFSNVCVANTNLCKDLLDVTGKCASCYFQSPSFYNLSPAGVCVLCSVTGCLTYSTACQCLSCQNGYQFINNQCVLCQSLHCHKCQTSVSICELCAPSYGRLSNACVACQQANCNNCDGDNTVCSTCNVGYYRSGGICYTCQANCLSCSSNIICTSCITGTYLQTNGRCKTLPANCIQIDVLSLGSNVGICKRCRYGYMLIEGNCYPCSNSLFNMQLCLNNHCPNYYALLSHGWHAFMSFLLLSFLAMLY